MLKAIISTWLVTLLLTACAGLGTWSGRSYPAWKQQQDQIYGVGGGGAN